MKHRYYIGIDCGVNTGVAIWDKEAKELIVVATMAIHKAMDIVRNAHKESIVRVEDARKRVWFGKSDREQLQGAGSIKRDAKIWEDFLKDLSIDYEMVAPKKNKTKLSAERFSQLTKWNKSSSVHARDAAMLVFGF